jgi:hypothetical protein
MEDEMLIQRLRALSSRLELRMREFAEHGTLSIDPEFKLHHVATGQVLFEHFSHLLQDLDGETIRHINHGTLP